MTAPPQDLTAALATLQARWGAAAPRRAWHGQGGAPGGAGAAPKESIGAVVGALAMVPLRAPDPSETPAAQPAPGSILSTGFAALDAILGPGGLPRAASVALRGEASSGTTTLALRLAAEAQASGLIVAWLDLSRSFDPVEAMARGVVPEWLVVVTPGSLDEGWSIAGSLLSGRSVDLLVVDLPVRAEPAGPPPAPGTPKAPPALARPAGRSPGNRRPSFADRLGRLAAMARRAGALFVVIEPPGLASGLAGAVADATGLRLELARRSWIHLGRDVVGQHTQVTVARNRFGPPGRRAELRILYAEGGERDACLQREGLLREAAGPVPAADRSRGAPPIPFSITKAPAPAATGIRSDASSPSLLATSPPGPRPAPLRLVPAGAGGGGRQALDAGERPGREPRGAGARHPARDAAGVGPPARP